MANFINPYNFVPLHGERRSEAGTEDNNEKQLTGKIEYTIKTRSPLFIPNSSEDRIFSVSNEPVCLKNGKPAYHLSYDFFSYSDLDGKKDQDCVLNTPVIPGSEIRGAVRSVFETLTNSCMTVSQEEEPISKRTPEQYKPGVIWKENGEWGLFAAKDYLVRDPDFSIKKFDRMREQDGAPVAFSAISRGRHAKPLADLSRTGKKGFLLKGKEGPELPKSKGSKCDVCPAATKTHCNGARCYLLEKHCAHVFTKDTLVCSIEDTDPVIRQIDAILRVYERNDHAYTEYKRSWRAFKEGIQNGIPVYYSEIVDDKKEKHYYYSPACITREVYFNTLKSLIGEHAKCSDKEHLCPACSLFGTVNTKKGWSLSSKIRFSDAVLKDEPADLKTVLFEKPVMLPELAEPKLSSAEFYLEKPETKKGTLLNWTYDYYIYEKKGIPYIVWNQPHISGRKYYWHHNPFDQVEQFLKNFQQNAQKKKTERNKTVRPVKPNVEFKGYLYFDHISETQLKQLIAIINMSEGTSYAMHLGSGKPFGLGSVDFRVNAVMMRNVSIDNDQFIYDPNGEYDPFVKKKNNIEEKKLFEDTSVLKYLDTNALQSKDKVVSYPKVSIDDESEEGFNWFGENRTARKMTRPNRENPVERLLNDRDAGPRSRRQIAYKEYMKPFHPMLVPVDAIEVGTEFAGTVTEVSEKKAFLKLENGRRISLFFRKIPGARKGEIDKILPVGTNVQVSYQGKESGNDGKQYDQWRLEEGDGKQV